MKLAFSTVEVRLPAHIQDLHSAACCEHYILLVGLLTNRYGVKALMRQEISAANKDDSSVIQ